MKRSTRFSVVVALLAAILVLLIRGTRRQRQLIRLLTGFTLANWFGDRASDIGGFFGSVGGDVKDFVTNIVQTVVDWAQGLFDWLHTLVNNAVDVATSLFHWANDTAADLVNKARDAANWLYWQAVDYADRLYNSALSFAQAVEARVREFASWLYWAAVDFAQRAVSTAVGFAQSLFDRARSMLDAAVGWVLSTAHSLIDTAVSALRAFGEWSFSTLRSLIDLGVSSARAFASGIVHVATDQLTNLVNLVRSGSEALVHALVGPLTSKVADATSYLFGPVSTLIGVIGDVVDWLISLATFPFTLARDVWATMRQTGGQRIIGHAPGFADRWADHIAAHAYDYVRSTDRPYQLPPLPHAGDPNTGGGGGGGGNVTGDGTPDRRAFAVAVLAGLSAPLTVSSLTFLQSWMAREGTSASFNPLATTLDYGSNTRFNSVGVRNYADMATGVAATVATLVGSGYPNIVAALRAGDGHAAGQQHDELARWSGGGYDTIEV